MIEEENEEIEFEELEENEKFGLKIGHLTLETTGPSAYGAIVGSYYITYAVKDYGRTFDSVREMLVAGKKPEVYFIEVKGDEPELIGTAFEAWQSDAVWYVKCLDTRRR